MLAEYALTEIALHGHDLSYSGHVQVIFGVAIMVSIVCIDSASYLARKDYKGTEEHFVI